MTRLVEGYHQEYHQPDIKSSTENPLTAAEQDILRRRRDGTTTDKAIAYERGCALSTVKGILNNLKDRLEEGGLILRQTSTLVMFADIHGWLEEGLTVNLTKEKELDKLRPMTEQEHKPASLKEINGRINRTNNVLSKVLEMAETPGGTLWPASLQHQVLDTVSDEDYLEKAAGLAVTLKGKRDTITSRAIPFFQTRVRELSLTRIGLAEQNLKIIQDSADGGLLRPEDLDRAQGIIKGWQQELGLPEQPKTTDTDQREVYFMEDIASTRGIDTSNKKDWNLLRLKVSRQIKALQLTPERSGKGGKLHFNPQEYQALTDALSASSTVKPAPRNTKKGSKDNNNPNPPQKSNNKDLAKELGIDTNNTVVYIRFLAKIAPILKEHGIAVERGKRREILYTPEQHQQVLALLRAKSSPKST